MDRLDQLRQVMLEATAKAEATCYWYRQQAEHNTDEYVQTLFDMSTFDCNKPIIAELFKVASGYSKVFREVDTSAQRRLNVLHSAGTVVRVLQEHDWHGYSAGDYAIVSGHRALTRGKVVMETLNPQMMEKGGNLYHYSFWDHIVFEPVDASVVERVWSEYFVQGEYGRTAMWVTKIMEAYYG